MTSEEYSLNISETRSPQLHNMVLHNKPHQMPDFPKNSYIQKLADAKESAVFVFFFSFHSICIFSLVYSRLRTRHRWSICRLRLRGSTTPLAGQPLTWSDMFWFNLFSRTALQNLCTVVQCCSDHCSLTAKWRTFLVICVFCPCATNVMYFGHFHLTDKY